jgi:hypothetical protein
MGAILAHHGRKVQSTVRFMTEYSPSTKGPAGAGSGWHCCLAVGANDNVPSTCSNGRLAADGYVGDVHLRG